MENEGRLDMSGIKVAEMRPRDFASKYVFCNSEKSFSFDYVQFYKAKSFVSDKEFELKHRHPLSLTR